MTAPTVTKTFRYAYGATPAGALIGALIFLGLSVWPGLIIFGPLDIADWTPPRSSVAVSTIVFSGSFALMLAASGFALVLWFRLKVLGMPSYVETGPDGITFASPIYGTAKIRFDELASIDTKKGRRNGIDTTIAEIRAVGRTRPMRIGVAGLRDPAYFNEIVAAVRHGMATARSLPRDMRRGKGPRDFEIAEQAASRPLWKDSQKPFPRPRP